MFYWVEWGKKVFLDFISKRAKQISLNLLKNDWTDKQRVFHNTKVTFLPPLHPIS